MPSITAIIPTYNRAGFLRQAIDGLHRQTRPVDDVIVWDDGSTDETLSVVQASGKAVRYFRSDNGGKSRALNAALAEARGDYVWICDDDDVAQPRAAETLGRMLDGDAAAGVAGGAYRRFRDGPDGRSEQGPGYWPDLTRGAPIRHLLEDIFLFQNAMLVRRDLYDCAGPFREDLPRSIDYDMIVRLGLIAPILLTEEVVFLQRKHDGDRGPAAARHAAARSDAVWQAADRDVFAALRDRIPLSFYAALYETSDPDLARRAALLQRGCVHARRTDWAAALADFEAAVQSLPRVRLSEVERDICRRATAGKHGIREALVPQVRDRLSRLARRAPAGADVARSLARGLRWRLREAATRRDWPLLAGTGRLAAALIRPGAGAGRPPAELTERMALPAAAYLGTVSPG